MNTSIIGSLPRWIVARAEAFFRMPFKNVRLIISDLPRLWGARAFAFGESLHILAEYANFSSPEGLALLGHELTHIAQQRQRNELSSNTCQPLLVDDSEQEAQAWRLGWRFATGATCDVHFACKQPVSQPVLQRAVLVDQKMVRSTKELEPNIQTTLDMIEGGNAWFSWAANDMNVRYEFANQFQLAQNIQSGLHGTPELLLNKLALWINPLTLLALNESAFKAITNFELNSGSKTAANKALRENQLYSQQTLSHVPRLLNNWKMTGEPVFQALGLQDMIALVNLASWLGTHSGDDYEAFQRECADFAVGLAQSPEEFSDYFQFYYTLGMLNDWPNEGTISQHQQAANQLIESMLPLLTKLLRGACLAERPTTQALQDFISAWQDTGFPLGFQRMSAAINQVTQQTAVGLPNQSVASEIEGYISESQAFIRTNEASNISLSQNGLVSKYAFENGSKSALVNWSSAGVLTFGFYLNSVTQPEITGETNRLNSTKGASNDQKSGTSQNKKTTQKSRTSRSTKGSSAS